MEGANQEMPQSKHGDHIENQEMPRDKHGEHLIESAADAAKHRAERGEPEPLLAGKSALGSHYDIGGVGEYGPVDTERNEQVDQRDIPARVP